MGTSFNSGVDFIGVEPYQSFLNQKGLVVWFTGLSGSGKSTLASNLEKHLFSRGFLTTTLDGDEIRNGINKDLGYSTEDRLENIRRVASVAKMFSNRGMITLCSFISPTKEIRDKARNIIGREHFLEVYVSTPLEECKKRDVKGLYGMAEKGIISNFTGISSPYETPENADLLIDTEVVSIEEAVSEICELLNQHGISA